MEGTGEMNEMVERVARSIAREVRLKVIAINGEREWLTLFPEATEDNQDANWRNHIPQAKAAIEAMRKPTEGMVEAGQDCDGYTPHDRNASCGRHWHAMIDAALRD